tara:strand:- start:5889 stop:8078 length:2190 start_codon:yes stop_codon:yes gene_type:complete
MAQVEQFTIKFDASGDKKLLGKLTALSLAMEKFSNAEKKVTAQSTKLNSTTLKLTAQLAAQGKRWQDLGVKTRTVSKAMRGNQVAIEKLRRAYKKQNTVNRVLGGSFAVLRSRLLLFNFAMALGGRQLIQFTREAAKVEAMERGFNTLTGASENSTRALEKLKKATNDTVSEFDLFQQANNAMILGVTKNSDEMAEMFDIAQRLGRVLGRDTKTSIESLVTGIGRQSRLMLDNIGIITKVEEANIKYARSLNKSVSQLTDTEKKQAFLNATMEAAREKVALLGDEVETTQDQIDAFDAAMDNLAANIGEGLGKAFLPLMRAMTKISEVMTPERVRAYATVIGSVLVVAMAAYVKTLQQAVIWQTRLGWGAFATAVGVVATEVLMLSGIFEDASDNIDLTAQKTDALAKGLMKLSLAELIHQQAVMNALITDSFNPYEKQLELIERYIDILQNGFSSMDDYVDKQTVLNDLFKKTPEGQKQLIEAQIKMTEAMIETTGATPELIAVLAMLEEQLLGVQSKMNEEAIQGTTKMVNAIMDVANAYDKVKMQQINQAKQAELDSVNGIRNERIRTKKLEEIEAKYAEKTRKHKEKMKKVKVAEAISNTALGITAAWDEPFPLNVMLAALIATSGALQIQAIKGQKYQYGGLVGGRRHSQGGTMIEAEQGEFVMSRDATEAIGIENLNRMNTGLGGGGGSTIVINNPILGKDMIEDEIVPQIQEALRRGGDIGV